jgi:hypothetical protein
MWDAVFGQLCLEPRLELLSDVELAYRRASALCGSGQQIQSQRPAPKSDERRNVVSDHSPANEHLTKRVCVILQNFAAHYW